MGWFVVRYKKHFDYIFYLGSKVSSWSFKKQKMVTLTSSEAEYIAVTDDACEVVWLGRTLLGVTRRASANYDIISYPVLLAKEKPRWNLLTPMIK